MSLGCARNLVDSEVMMGKLLEHGWSFSNIPQSADAIVINTCSFIESAKKESVTKILEAVAYKQDNPNLKVVVAGCLAQRYGKKLQADIPEVDLFVGTDQFHRIAELLETPIFENKIIAKAHKLHLHISRPQNQYTVFLLFLCKSLRRLSAQLRFLHNPCYPRGIAFTRNSRCCR